MSKITEFFIALILAITVAGCIAYSKVEKKPSVVDEPMTGMYLFVYNKKTDTWNRASDEDLKNATCENLKIYRLREI